jgi:glutamate synthase domain-containing protein 2
VSYEAQSRFQSAIEEGVLKILSKMGIATVDSYRGRRSSR